MPASTHARVVLISLLSAALGGSPAASAQTTPQPATQTLVINYPNSGANMGAQTAPYKGLVYVKVFAADPELIKKYGAGPVSAAELTPSGRDVRQLPLGRYEVQFAYRVGSELKTFVLRDVILRPDRAGALTVELNDAKTTIVGGDPSIRQMAEMIGQLQAQVKDLQAQVAALKK
ncbi:hypothetical protein QR90_06125 [Deinococcus radiopugnans]|uniref:DUF2846 domain-containing protein n=1 Tax=Deinococcus radiopugnans TaxID=57497 RepID=A0A0A7KF40_9DEIO|nr:hypothetical protein [Deinococcus radiopugnans]AIZ44761.1 hypothetical protein QR90_06125 [Deinococcus radiopugnans]